MPSAFHELLTDEMDVRGLSYTNETANCVLKERLQNDEAKKHKEAGLRGRVPDVASKLLREVLANNGLPTSGDESTLKKRFDAMMRGENEKIEKSKSNKPNKKKDVQFVQVTISKKDLKALKRLLAKV